MTTNHDRCVAALNEEWRKRVEPAGAEVHAVRNRTFAIEKRLSADEAESEQRWLAGWFRDIALAVAVIGAAIAGALLPVSAEPVALPLDVTPCPVEDGNGAEPCLWLDSDGETHLFYSGQLDETTGDPISVPVDHEVVVRVR